MTDVLTKAIFLDCIECDKRFGALVVVEDKVINGEEVGQFLKSNEVFPLCWDCHLKVGENGPDQRFEVK